jgi:2-phosphoglycerate kinase
MSIYSLKERSKVMGVMITTEDNPHDPRSDFRAWDQWDRAQGYNTCAYLDRVQAVAEDFPEEVRDRMLEDAIDEIIELHGGLMYIKLEVDEPPTSPRSTAA